MIYCDESKIRAEISVFLALSAVLIFALLLAVLESARTSAARLHFTVAANSAIDSVFSQYHDRFWEDYRLLGLEHYAPGQITDEFRGFMDPYLEAENWFPMSFQNAEIIDMSLLTDDNGKVFEEEVLDYMKYGIAASVWDLQTLKTYTEGVKEGTGSADISGLYREHAVEASRLEKDLEEISGCISRQQELWQKAKRDLENENGEGFIRTADEMIRELENVPKLEKQYETDADILAEGLTESEQKTEAAVQNGTLSQSTAEMMQEDIREYRTYVSEDGKRRREIAGLPALAAARAELLQELIEEAEEIQERIEAKEPYDEEDEADEGEEEDDEENPWEPLLLRLERADPLKMDSGSGLRDTETEQKLENLSELLKTGFWKLILPSGKTISAEKLPMEERPSELCYTGTDTSTLGAADRIFVTEYMLRMMDCYDRREARKGKKPGSGHLEAEYVLFGGSNDSDNLLSVTGRLVRIRTGLNLAFLYSDSTRRTQARMLAMEITGALGLTPLCVIMSFFIMSVWAMAQAVCDVRDLLAGEKVPFMHNHGSFYLTLQGLLQMASGMPAVRSQGREGLNYADYLRILLFFEQDSLQEYRCMDVIQMNLRKEQTDFRIDRLIRSLELEVSVQAGHVFTRPEISGSVRKAPGGLYEMHVTTAYSY